MDDVVYGAGQHYVVRALKAPRGRRRPDGAYQVLVQGNVMDRVLLKVSGTSARAQAIAAAGQAGGAVLLASGRPIAVRSCATCCDQPVPALACPSCGGSGDPCRPRLSGIPARTRDFEMPTVWSAHA